MAAPAPALVANILEVSPLLSEVQRSWAFLENLFVFSDEVKKELPDETDNEVQRSWAFLEDLFVFSEVQRSWAFLENLFVFLDAVLAAPAPALVANIPEVSPLLSEMQRSWAFLETLFVFSVAVLAAPAPRPRLLSCTRRTPARHPRGQHCRGLDAAVRGAALLGLPGEPLRLLGGAAQPFRFLPGRRAWP